MKLTINGEIKEFTAQMTLERILEELHIKDQVMAAAVNMQIIKQNEWTTHRLSDGDKIELLDFVGGG
jgi:sulfur carrier protein